MNPPINKFVTPNQSVHPYIDSTIDWSIQSIRQPNSIHPFIQQSTHPSIQQSINPSVLINSSVHKSINLNQFISISISINPTKKSIHPHLSWIHPAIKVHHFKSSISAYVNLYIGSSIYQSIYQINQSINSSNHYPLMNHSIHTCQFRL